MDSRLLDYYERELKFLRESGTEFAQEFPNKASQLALSDTECADPHVERLLEGFAFLAARVQLEIDASFPRFTQSLLQMIYPDYLRPAPSAAIMQLVPNYEDAAIVKGLDVPRHSKLIAQRTPDSITQCEYRTSHAVTLYPLRITAATYQTYAGDFPPGLSLARQPKAVLRLTLAMSAGAKFNQLTLNSLPLYLGGAESTANRLYEALLGAADGMFVTLPKSKRMLGGFLEKSCIRECGFSDDEAMLQCGLRTFQGHRLLQEYFLFPARFLFVRLDELARSLRAADVEEIEIVVPLSRHDPILDGAVSADDFALFCTPAVNLFPKRTDRIDVTGRQHEYHIVPDRTRPLDFEVHSVLSVTGYGDTLATQREFTPFYAVYDDRALHEGNAHYTLRRIPRPYAHEQRRARAPTSYQGTEVYLSLVDRNNAPYAEELQELGLKTLCTNRDLPSRLRMGSAKDLFTLEDTSLAQSVICRRGPTVPQPAPAPGESAWRLIGMLSQNYLSLLDSNAQQGADALRELLAICAVHDGPDVRKQISALRNVASRQIVRRLPASGPLAFGRGTQVELEIDEASLGGSGAFLMGSVLRYYLARHASINGFVQTALKVNGKGEVMQWPLMIGTRPIV